MHAAIATVAALYRAQKTGVGERVECSMLEATVAALPWPVLYQSVLGHGPPVVGNRDELAAPLDVYRCAGLYEWVAISVRTDSQFEALATLIGRPDLADLSADDQDAIITAWSAPLDAQTAAAALRAAGVPAEYVAHTGAVAESQTLLARGFFNELPHTVVGARRLWGPAWHASRSPMVATSAAPCLGAHTRSVLTRTRRVRGSTRWPSPSTAKRTTT